jgi:hypothetical protein
MLSKCANPSCSNSFRYMHEGKLFHMEMEKFEAKGQPGAASFQSKTIRQTEFFWLCEDCAPRMTVKRDRKKGTIVVKPLAHGLRAAS